MRKVLSTGSFGYSLCAVTLWLIAFQPILKAQETEFDAEFKDLPKKKQPSFFHRPAKDSPATQLEYAKCLLAKGKIRNAMKQYRALVHTWHDSPEAVIAQQAYAELLENKRRYSRAFDEFQYLIDNYTGHFPYEEALEHQFRIANHLMTARRGKFFIFPGFTAPERAVGLFEKLVQNAPNWDKTPQAQFCIGLIHEQLKDYELAIKAYEATQNCYPNSDFAAEASFRRGYCLYISANASPRDEVSCRNALSALAGFLSEGSCGKDYPENTNAEVARQYLDELKKRLAGMYYERAVFYDEIEKRSQAALIAYRDFIKKFPFSEMAEKAAERIEILGKKSNGKIIEPRITPQPRGKRGFCPAGQGDADRNEILKMEKEDE